jgi:hypothetical protein
MRPSLKFVTLLVCAIGLAGCNQTVDPSISAPATPAASELPSSEPAVSAAPAAAASTDDDIYRPGTSDLTCSADLIANGLECLPPSRAAIPEEGLEPGADQ